VLEAYLRERAQEEGILLMTHIVLGYPSFEASFELVRAMVEAGVDLVELQIPFSEPIADGPVILRANQESLAAGTTVAQCLEFGEKVAAEFPIPVLFMSYYNILHTHGVDAFVERMASIGVRGAIVPDVPPEEGGTYVAAMASRGLAPIFIYAPTTSDARMRYIGEHASGFIYCVARRGVTGADTSFSDDLEAYLRRCRQATSLPLAVGFGVKNRADVDFLRGKAEIAVIGTQVLRIFEEDGVAAVGSFLTGLRQRAPR
jgi:tryptophan synthase alpha chain